MSGPDIAALVKELNAVVPYQGKSAVAFLCHEAAATITALQAEVARLREALEVIDAKVIACPHNNLVGRSVAATLAGTLRNVGFTACAALERTKP